MAQLPQKAFDFLIQQLGFFPEAIIAQERDHRSAGFGVVEAARLGGRGDFAPGLIDLFHQGFILFHQGRKLFGLFGYLLQI